MVDLIGCKSDENGVIGVWLKNQGAQDSTV